MSQLTLFTEEEMSGKAKPQSRTCEIRYSLDFDPHDCGRCRHCYLDLDRRICVCSKYSRDIGKNAYCYKCDDWEKNV